MWYPDKPYIEGDGPDGQEATLNRRYMGKSCQTEHGPGVVVGIDLPRSQAWRLKIEVPEHTLSRVQFSDNVLCFVVGEVTFE